MEGMTMRRWMLLSAATALLAAGCSGGARDEADSQTEKGREYVDAIMTGSEDEELNLDENQVRCAAEGWVDLYGIEGFEDAGVSPEDIRAVADDEGFPSLLDSTDEQADGFVDVLVECVDFGEVIADSLAEEPDAPELSRDQLDCIGSRLEESGEFREAMKAEFLGGEASDVDMTAVAAEAFDDCGVSFGDLLGS
jgi:hypothetical protein